MSQPETLGELIRDRRLARGMSLGQLATSVGRTAATVRAWERDQHAPAVAIIEQLAGVLDVDVQRILDFTSQDPPELTLVAADDDADDAGVAEVAVVDVETDADDEATGDTEAGDVVGAETSGEAEEQPTEPVVVAAEPDELAVLPRVDTAGADLEVDVVDDAEPEGETEPGAVLDITDEPTQAIPPPVPATPPPSSVTTPPVTAPAAASTATAVGARPGTVLVPTSTLEEPPLPQVLSSLRVLFDPKKRWLYWLRAALTVVVLLVMAGVLLWALRELFTAIGAVLDSIEPTDTIESDLVLDAASAGRTLLLG